MPTYEYKCKKCKHEFEEIQSISADPLVLCPVCKTQNLVRIISKGGGMIFKGADFIKRITKTPSRTRKNQNQRPKRQNRNRRQRLKTNLLLHQNRNPLLRLQNLKNSYPLSSQRPRRKKIISFPTSAMQQNSKLAFPIGDWERDDK